MAKFPKRPLQDFSVTLLIDINAILMQHWNAPVVGLS